MSSTESKMKCLSFQIRGKNEEDKEWIIPYMRHNWGSEKMVTKNKVYNATELLGFIAEQNEKPVGIALYNIENKECEIVLLESFIKKNGIGSSLIDCINKIATTQECKRVWLITTNDNLAAIRFYQMRGFSLVAIYHNAINESRKLKPEIPLRGIDGISIRDEIELELLID